MNKVKRPHYLPKMYLKNFTNTQGKICAYRIDGTYSVKNIIQNTSIENIAVQKGIYSLSNDNGEDDTSFDGFLSRYFEEPGSKLLEKLLNKSNTITDLEKIQFLIFFASLINRSPNTKDQVMKYSRPMFEETIKFLGTQDTRIQEVAQMIDSKQLTLTPSNINFLNMIIDSTGWLADKLYLWKMEILYTSDSKFITCDKPTIFSVQQDLPNVDYFDNPHAVIYFPISNNLLVALRNIKSPPRNNCFNIEYRTIPKNSVREMNKLFAKSANTIIVGADSDLIKNIARFSNLTPDKSVSVKGTIAHQAHNESRLNEFIEKIPSMFK